MILAVDPGKTTGWALWTSDGIMDCGQVAGRYSFYDKVSYWRNFGEPIETFVVEKFTITEATARMSKQYDALFINGWLDAEAYLYETEFVEQTPSQAKGVMSDKALKACGWWRPGKGWEHAMDASRHLGLYLINHRMAGIAEKILSA